MASMTVYLLLSVQVVTNQQLVKPVQDCSCLQPETESYALIHGDCLKNRTPPPVVIEKR